MESEKDNTDVSLKEYIEKIFVEKDKYYERLFEEKDKALNAALSTAKEAVAVAEKNAEKWRDNANEWRGAMTDKDKNLMQRSEFITFKDGYEKVVDELKSINSQGKGKMEGVKDFRDWIPWAIAIIMFGLYIYNLKK